jgi:DNA repair exonuclease SbcCD ATPase subunit
MKSTCAASCDAACADLGESPESTQTNQTHKHDMAALDKKLEHAKQELQKARDWESKMLKATAGCPCPGRDFQPPESDEAPDTPNTSGGGSDKLVHYYMKKFHEVNNWTPRQQRKLHEARRSFSNAQSAERVEGTSALEAVKSLEQDPLFQDAHKDLCPCVNDYGFKEMMEAYATVKATQTSSPDHHESQAGEQ